MTYSSGVLWSFNYLFYNRKMKRIVYMSCIARSGYADNLETENSRLEADELMEDDGDESNISDHDQEPFQQEIIEIWDSVFIFKTS